MALAGPIEQSVTEDDLHLGARYAKLSPRRQRMMRELLEELEAAEKANLQIAKAADGSPD